MKKLTAILMAMVLMLSMSVTGNAETVVYKGMAKFMISEQHMIEGTIELEEDIPHTFYQKSCWKSPRGTKGDGTIIRDKVMSMADIAGYTEMYARIEICDEWLPRRLTPAPARLPCSPSTSTRTTARLSGSLM